RRVRLRRALRAADRPGLTGPGRRPDLRRLPARCRAGLGRVSADPFGTQRLREAVLSAWSASPTRFREDANAEEDLRLGAYKDRLLVELAQNAADAASFGGALRLSIVDNELRVANTGTPLDADGVAALASLRASAK